MSKYAIDTNVYIDAFRNAEGAERLKQFLRMYLPATYLSAVVVLELRTGARTPEQIKALESVFTPFERRRRILTPSVNAFKESGRILAALAGRDGLDLSRSKASLANDVLLAASCREQGVTLITHDSDFARIKQHLKGFQRLAPWP